MKVVFHNRKTGIFSVFVITLIWAAVVLAGSAWATEPGVTLEITILKDGQEVTDPKDMVFIAGSQVGVKMVLKNNTKFPINTERGFSKLEPHRFLVLIDPANKHHYVGGIVTSGDAPAPFFLGDKTTIPAETLPSGWTKTVTISDMAKLFPVIEEDIGWYTLEANVPFVRLVWTLEDKQLGLLGVENDDRNFTGTIDANSKQIQLTLAPDVRGAFLRVQVLDQSTNPQTPINQVPIRIYENADIEGLDLSQAWATGPDAAALTGTTDLEGWAVWTENLCKIEADYTAIAYYQNEYKDASFTQAEDGWLLQCGGVIEKTILYGEVDTGGQEVVDDLVTVSYGRVIYNRRTGQYSYTVTMVNNSDVDLKGPVWLVIENLLPAGAVVSNADGQMDGNSYIEAFGDGVSFNAGDTLSNITLIITNTSRLRITFDDQVLAVKP